MARIYQMPTQIPGTVDVSPNLKFCVFGDDVETVSSSGYLNQGDLQSISISTTDVLCAFYDFDLNTNIGSYGQFSVAINGAGVITLTQIGDAGTGTVDDGLQNQLAYYASTGDTASGLATANNAVLVTSGTGVPSLSTTLPDGLAMQTPASLDLTNALDLPLGGISVGTNSAMIVTDSLGDLSAVGPMTDGQIVIGATGATPVATTITAGGNISIDNGAGSITISSSSFQWLDASETTVAMEINKGYIASNSGLVTLTLPAIAPVGARVAVQDSGAGGWTIAQNAGQRVRTNSGQSTTGVTGTTSSSQIFDVIYILCVEENTEWVFNGGFGNYVFT